MLFFYILFGLAMGSALEVKANLDGTINPIFVDAFYSFTDGEAARGFVYFKSGFSIPATGTVTLELAVPMRGGIQFNGGTLILYNDLIIDDDHNWLGPGFINTRGYSITINDDWFLSSGNSSHFTFLGSNVILKGNNSFLGIVNGSLNFEQLTANDAISLLNFRITNIRAGSFNDNFISPGNQRIKFTNCTMLFANNEITMHAPRILFEGNCRLLGYGPHSELTIPNSLEIAQQATLILDSGFQLNVSEDIVLRERCDFILRNALLTITHSLSPTIPIDIPGYGRFCIEGSSTIRSLNPLSLDTNIDVIFSPGGRLILDEQTSLKIN